MKDVISGRRESNNEKLSYQNDGRVTMKSSQIRTTGGNKESSNIRTMGG